MLLYIKHYGQMCNRLWALTPVIAYALHTKKKVYVLFAKKAYLNCFPKLDKNRYLCFGLSHDCSKPKSIEWRLVLFSEKYHLEVKEDLKDFRMSRLVSFVDGWQHVDDESYIIEQKSEIVDLLKPDESVVQKVDGYFKNYDGITIGVHVRRGDYKDYLAGKYYFSDDVYVKVIEKINLMFVQSGRKVRFVICSNESLGFYIDNVELFSIKDSDGITDLYALSCCDYIVGPPSSYSQWASFYGNVPLCVLLNDNPKISEGSFSRVISFNTFENGKRLKLDNITEEYVIT